MVVSEKGKDQSLRSSYAEEKKSHSKRQRKKKKRTEENK